MYNQQGTNHHVIEQLLYLPHSSDHQQRRKQLGQLSRLSRKGKERGNFRR